MPRFLSHVVAGAARSGNRTDMAQALVCPGDKHEMAAVTRPAGPKFKGVARIVGQATCRTAAH